jgi:hypothetical protein
LTGAVARACATEGPCNPENQPGASIGKASIADACPLATRILTRLLQHAYFVRTSSFRRNP